jgi:hypothetical protein
MKQYKIYFYTTISFLLFYTVLSVVFIPSLSKYSISFLLENEINSGKQKAQQIASLSGASLNTLNKKEVTVAIQKAIEDVEDEIIFLSIVDWSGNIVNYPDITQVSTKSTKKSTLVSNIKQTISGEELYSFIQDYKLEGDVSFASEIIHLNPIPNSDWIVTVHINIKNTLSKLNTFKNGLYTTFIILGLLILVFLLTLLRFISSYYQSIIEEKSIRLEDGVLNLSKLNTSLENYQKSVTSLTEAKTEVEQRATEKEEVVKETPKKRLLTYIRNELMPVAIEDISYIYVENTITYIVRNDGKRYTANDSLDQIYSSLDNKLFFRANRQIIVSIYAIDKVIKYGNSSLKIETKPKSEIDIIIGKNKASLFKQWLDL